MIMNDKPGFSSAKSNAKPSDKSDASKTLEAEQENTRKTFGKNMRLYLKMNKLSQQELARRMDLDPSTISRYVTGKTFPSPEHLDKICKIFGVPVSTLYGESGNGRPVIREDQSFEKDSLLEAIVTIAATLSRNGQEKVYRYMLDLVDEEGAHTEDSVKKLFK